MNRVELKERAKVSLKGKYGDAIAVMGIEYLINVGVEILITFIMGICAVIGFGTGAISLLSIILSFAVTGLIGFGKISFYLKLSRNEDVNYREVFSKFELCLPYILISVTTGIFVFLWSLLFIIPGIIASLSYTLVYYIKLDNPELDTMEVINKSKEMMNSHKMDYAILSLSFIGWSILGIFTFGLLYLWLTPYMSVTFANFYNSLKEQETTN